MHSYCSFSPVSFPFQQLSNTEYFKNMQEYFELFANVGMRHNHSAVHNEQRGITIELLIVSNSHACQNFSGVLDEIRKHRI